MVRHSGAERTEEPEMTRAVVTLD